jgi:hypothetical protein
MQAYAVISLEGVGRSDFVMYVAMVETKKAALDAVRKKYDPPGFIEISGYVQEATVRALDLQPGEVRRL